MLLASNQATRLSRRSSALLQLNPEVSEIMSATDDKEYAESQKNILYEQNFNNTDKYSMSLDQYESLVQKEKEKEMQEKEDQAAHENLVKLEQEIDGQRYSQIVEMVAGSKKTRDEKAKMEADDKKKVEE